MSTRLSIIAFAAGAAFSGVAFNSAKNVEFHARTNSRTATSGSIATARAQADTGAKLRRLAAERGTWPYVDVVLVRDYSEETRGGDPRTYIRVHMDIALKGTNGNGDIDDEFDKLHKELKKMSPNSAVLLKMLKDNKDLDPPDPSKPVTVQAVRTLKAALGCTKVDDSATNTCL